MHPSWRWPRGSGERLRLKTPPVPAQLWAKHAVFAYVVMMSLEAPQSRAAVKWVETRLEHLTPDLGTNRVTTLTAAVMNTASSRRSIGTSSKIAAPICAPPTGDALRMHGQYDGAYRVPNLASATAFVTTNKTASGLCGGLAGPQVYSRWNG